MLFSRKLVSHGICYKYILLPSPPPPPPLLLPLSSGPGQQRKERWEEKGQAMATWGQGERIRRKVCCLCGEHFF